VLWDHGHIKFWSHKSMREVLTESHFTNLRFSGAARIPWLWQSMVVRAVLLLGWEGTILKHQSDNGNPLGMRALTPGGRSFWKSLRLSRSVSASL
jgi:hypothetical protein